ncbi:MAG: hypothetical protein Kow0059_07190 [Candidatus Sumerlaeia bacterium]
MNTTSTRRVVIFGTCPLPWEPYPVAGPALRTFQLMRPLWEAGCEVLIIALRTPGVYPADVGDLCTTRPFERVEFCHADYKIFTQREWVRRKIESFRPDAIVGAGSLLPNFEAGRWAGLAPFWADVFGDPVSELQSKGGAYGHDSTRGDLHHVWNLLTAVLLRGDRFSTLSGPQRLALIGQLGLCGRLNAHTDGLDLVASIPCGVDERDEAAQAEPERMADEQRREAAGRLGLAEAFAAASADGGRPFILLWAGSYNTWIDEATLFSGVEQAMAADPHIVFVSAGGGTEGYNPEIYERFRRRVEASRYRSRFAMLGWRPIGEMPRYYALADVGLNVDRYTYEGVLGSRNRVVQFLKFGVPVLSTSLSEITTTLAARDLITTFPIGDARAFSETILRLSRHPAALTDQARRGRRFVLDEFGFEKTTQPLLAWVADPRRAPDNAAALAVTGALPGPPGSYTLDFQRLLDSERFMPWIREIEARANRPGLLRKLFR